MGNKKQTHFLKSQFGQSTVEYVLLLAVVVSLFVSIFRSPAFQQFFGEDSSFFNAIAQKMRLDYRYGTNVTIDEDIGSGISTNHPTFAQPDGSASRFFGYPQGGTNYPP
jgi:Flp pilus assembly pilin Flp